MSTSPPIGPHKRVVEGEASPATRKRSEGALVPTTSQPGEFKGPIARLAHWVHLTVFPTNLAKALLPLCKCLPSAYQDQAKQLINELPPCNDAVVKSIRSLNLKLQICLIIGLLTDTDENPSTPTIRSELLQETFDQEAVLLRLYERKNDQPLYVKILRQCASKPGSALNAAIEATPSAKKQLIANTLNTFERGL